MQITLVWRMLRIFQNAKFSFFLFSHFFFFFYQAHFITQEQPNLSLYAVLSSSLLHADESLLLWFLTYGNKPIANIYSMGPKNHSTFSSPAVALGWGCMFSKSSSSFSLIVNCCHGLPRLWVQHNNSCCEFVCIPITTVRAEGCYPPPALPLNITVSSLISHS